MKGALVSVVIPTRERADVLSKSLQTVTTQDYDALEIIVSDNYSGDHTREIVRAANDPRVKYINTGKRVSMSENWEFALGHVTGDLVTIIGDDDGLLPNSIKLVAQIFASTGVMALRSSVCSYSWPSLTGKSFGRLAVPMGSDREMRDSHDWLARVLQGRATYPQLPMLYNGGYASMAVLREIKARTGAFYRACNPDIYSAVSISLVTDRYMYISEPLAINGGSHHSTGTSHFSVKTVSASSPGAIFQGEQNLPFHEDVPLCADESYPKSLAALVYESYLQAAGLRTQLDADMHERQLQVILAQAGVYRQSVEEWGHLFAERHRLDFATIKARSLSASRQAAIRGALRTAVDLLNTYSVGSPELPIPDVYEASLVAQAIRKADYSRLRNIFRRAARVLNRE